MNRMTQISIMTKFYFLLIFIALALCSFCHSVKKHEATRWLRKARKGHNSPPATKWIGGVARSDEVVKKTIHKNLRVSAPFRVKTTFNFQFSTILCFPRENNLLILLILSKNTKPGGGKT